MNFHLPLLWRLLRPLPGALTQRYRQQAAAWERETGTKPQLIALGTVVALLWAFAAIAFVSWVGDLIRYVA